MCAILYSLYKQKEEGKCIMGNVKRRHAAVERGVCVACGSCEDVCPRGAVKVMKGSYAAVDISLCIGCGRCEMVCPAGAVTMEVAE
jgi:MinD superfamily P-loop ATPase